MDNKEQVFTQMVREQKSTIYAVCYMFSKDTDEIDDLFQEILIRLWKGYDSFRAESDVRTWIYRVSLNSCLNADKKRRRAGERVPLSVDIDPFEDTDDRALQTKRLYARWLSIDKRVTQVAGVALVLVLVSFSIWRGVPWRITILLSAFGWISVLAVLWVYKKLSLDTLYGEDILTATKKVRRFKQQYMWLELAIWVALLALLGALSPMIYRIWSPSGKATSAFVMLAVGVVICAVVNVFYFRRMMKACDSILERLESQ